VNLRVETSIMTFPSLEQALHAGFRVCKRTERGYLVGTRTASGWLQADVDVSTVRRKADAQRAAVIEGSDAAEQSLSAVIPSPAARN
jgi:methylphosphotriester-DNA--protein-cysteine methyltransferase